MGRSSGTCVTTASYSVHVDSTMTASAEGSVQLHSTSVQSRKSSGIVVPLEMGFLKEKNPNFHGPILEVQEEKFEGGESNLFKTVVNMVCTMAGVGVLGLATAVARIGWLISLLSFLFAGAAACFCAIILSRVMLFGRKSSKFESEHAGDSIAKGEAFQEMLQSYADIGEFAFGKVGKFLSNFSVLSMCLGSSILLIILGNSMIKNIFGDNVLPNYALGLINVGILFPFVFLRNYTSVAIIGFIGTCATSTAALLIVVMDFLELANPAVEGEIKTTAFCGGIRDIMSTFTVIVFSFGGCAVFPDLILCMREPRKFPKASKISFSILIFMYIPVAFASYFILGQDALLDPDNDSNVVNALPKSNFTYALYVAVWLAVLTTYIILMLPVFTSIELMLGFVKDNQVVHRASLRVTLVACTYLVGVMIPFFGDIMSFIGGTSITLSSFLLPISYYLKVFGRDLISKDLSRKDLVKGYIEIFCCIVIFVLTLVAGVSGTVSAVQNIVNSWGSYSFFS
eukprot:Nk52_evm22s554 gene=Nk52_evmTU22s554